MEIKNKKGQTIVKIDNTGITLVVADKIKK
jgi:hypothetical protein